MKPLLSMLSTGATVAVAVFALASLTNRSFVNAARANTEEERIERGRYLVHRVGMCVDCHSPRNEKGQFIEEMHLTGAALNFKSDSTAPRMPVAPKIAGLPNGFTAEDTVHFLMTGERPNGRPAPLPPMPAYRLERADAEAVTAYLRSLTPVAR
jgi:mono/diheme cytochrome c family protein